MENDDFRRKEYERAVLGQTSMALLQIMEKNKHPRYEEYKSEAISPNNDNPVDGFTEIDRKLLIKAYKEDPITALSAFLEVPEVIEILGINLDDD